MSEGDDAAHVANIHGTLLAIKHELELLPDDEVGNLSAVTYYLHCAIVNLEGYHARKAGGDE